MRHALIAARKAHQYTQQELADLIAVDRTSINQYERGRSDIPGRILRKLSDELHVPMDVLYLDSDTQPCAEGVGVSQPITVLRAQRTAKLLHRQTGELVTTLEALAMTRVKG